MTPNSGAANICAVGDNESMGVSAFGFTRAPLTSEDAFVVEICPRCERDNRTDPDLVPPFTRSMEPVDGAHILAYHDPWCIEVMDTPLGCPGCGAQVGYVSYELGMVYKTAAGRVHVKGGDYAPDTAVAEPELWPEGDRILFLPCKHMYEDDEARYLERHDAIARCRVYHSQVEAKLERQGRTIEAVRARGFAAVADAYEDAVRNSYATEPGLLLAMNLIAEGDTPSS